MELLDFILTILHVPFFTSNAHQDYTEGGNKASNCPSFTQMIYLLSHRNKTKPL